MSACETKKQKQEKLTFLKLQDRVDARIFIHLLKYSKWNEWQKLATTNKCLNRFVKNNYDIIRKILNMPIIKSINFSKFINMFDNSTNKANQIKRKSFAIQIDNRHLSLDKNKTSINLLIDASGSTKTLEGQKSRYEWFCEAIKNIPFENIKDLNIIQLTFFDDTIKKQYIFKLSEFISYKEQQDNELSGQNPFGGGTVLYSSIMQSENNLKFITNGDKIISLVLTDGETSEGYNNGFSFISNNSNDLQNTLKSLYDKSCTRIFVGVGSLDKKVGNCGSAVFIPTGDKLNQFFNTIIDLANNINLTQLKIECNDDILKSSFYNEYTSDEEKEEVKVINNIPVKKLPCLEKATISNNCITLELSDEFQILNNKEKFELLNALRQNKVFYYKKYDNKNFWRKLQNIKICKLIKTNSLINFKISYFVNGKKYTEILTHRLDFNFSSNDNPFISKIPESDIITSIQNELLKIGNINEVIEFGRLQDHTSHAYQMSQALQQTPSNLRHASAAAIQASSGMPSLQRQTSAATQDVYSDSDSDDDLHTPPLVNRFSTAPASNDFGIVYGSAAAAISGNLYNNTTMSFRQSTAQVPRISRVPRAPIINRSLAQYFSDEDDDVVDEQFLFGNTNRNLFNNENDNELLRIESNRMRFNYLPKGKSSKRTRALDLAGDTDTREKKKRKHPSNEV